jgi:hypothetical protein
MASMQNKFSDRECQLMKLVRAAGNLSSVALIEKFYGGDTPFHGRQIVTGSMRELIRKIEHNHEEFSITASPRRGPHPIEYTWHTKRP